MHESDELIYQRYLKDKDERDLCTLLERHREGLMLFLFGYVHNEEDAEELMMDSFAVVASGTARFSGKSSFKTWLFGIGRNQAKMLLRKRKGLFVSLDDVGEIEEIADADELEILHEEDKKNLYEAMESIPYEYRQVLFLLYFEEMSRDEICEVMKKNKKQVYNLAERGKNALREELQRRGYQYEKYK